MYDPDAPLGSRFSVDGLSASTVPRLYHSSATLLPDGSVFVSGSNPNPDVTSTSRASEDEPPPPLWNLIYGSSSYGKVVHRMARRTLLPRILLRAQARVFRVAHEARIRRTLLQSHTRLQ